MSKEQGSRSQENGIHGGQSYDRKKQPVGNPNKKSQAKIERRVKAWEKEGSGKPSLPNHKPGSAKRT